MSLAKRISQLGIAKQSAKGTPATVPVYTIGLTSGQVAKAEISQDDLNTSWSSRGLVGQDRISVIPGVDFEAVAMPNSIGLLLLLACGAVTTTGTTPKQHVFKPASSVPYATFFGLYDAVKDAISDCKIDSLELSWDKTGAVKVKVTAMGIVYDFANTWVIGSTAEFAQANLLKGVGGVFQVNTVTARVTGGSIKIDNQVAPVIASYATTPDEIAIGDVKCEVSLTIVPDDLLLFRTVYTGTAAGTTAQSIAEFGSVDLKWVLDANNDLAFNAPNIIFATDFPDVDPNGGPAEITLSGVCAMTPAAAEPFSFTLHNAVTSY